jgi:hypothetical protein
MPDLREDADLAVLRIVAREARAACNLASAYRFDRAIAQIEARRGR